MRYCMTYNPEHSEIDYYKGYANEIIFEERAPADVLNNFGKYFSLIFDMEEIEPEWLQIIKSNNAKIRIPSPDYESLIKACQKTEIPFFFEELSDSEEELMYIINLGVSDVYITGALGFHLVDWVRNELHDKNIQVRVFPNVCQSKAKKSIPDIQKFFIRPEDLDIYDKGNLIDVCEMWGPLSKQKTFIKIYKEDKCWAGPLSEVIIGFHDELDNRHFFYPTFAANRLNCMQKCLWYPCDVCIKASIHAKYLKEKNLLVKQIDKKEK